MLNSMRGKGQSKVMWVIMGLLMLGLTGFGIGGIGGGNIRSIGTVGDEPIETNTYARAYQNAAARLNQQAGRTLTAAELENFGVQQQVLDAVVGQAALNNEAATRGLSVGDETVRTTILQSTQFQGLDGTFDRESYNFYLERQLGITASEFETLIRKENARALVENTIVSGVSGDLTVPTTLMKFAQQERSFEWAALGEDNLGTPIATPSDEDLQAYYDAHAANYLSPLTRNITYAWLNPTDLLDKVAVDEAEIRESYDLQADRFNKVEQRAVDRIIFPTTEDAQSARDRLDAQTATFSEIVAERGLEDADVDLGEVSRSDLGTAVADLLFGATEPGVVGPVQSDLGPALFRINAVLAADSTPYEDVRDELRNELAGESARRLVSDRVSEIDDMLASGADLETLAKDTEMTLNTVAFFDGTDAAIAGYDEFRAAALDAQQGDFPEVLDLSDGGVFALRLDSIDQPKAIPLEDVREKVAADWRADQLNTALKALAERLKPGLEKGGDLSIMGLNLTPVDGIKRNSFLEQLPPTAVLEAYKLDKGDVAIVDGGDSVVLLRLTDITEFDPDLGGNDVVLERIKGQLDAQISIDMLSYYTDALQAKAGVQLNRAIISQINAQVTGF
nr:SurA N-terminal domain-containing protein [Amylibacter sp.]